MSAGPLLVTLLRHGEVEGPPHAFHGASDPPLSARGWAQLRAALAAVGEPAITAVACSPLQRCQAFAAALAEGCGVALHVDPDLAEMRFGEWDGLSAIEVVARDPARLAAFRADPVATAAPGGEPYDAFAARVRASFAAWTGGQNGGHALLVAHAGPMRALIAEALGIAPAHAWRIALPYAATCRLSLLEGEAPVLLALNFAPEPAAAPT